jgi:hypothetical protein
MSISLALSSASAIPDLDTLTSTVADWLDRDDLDTKIATFVLLAESMFNRELRTPEMENPYTFTVSDEDTPLPSDFLAMRAIYREASPDTPLRAMSPTALKQEFSGTTGVPVAYALVSGGIRVAPPPASDELLTMDYFAEIDHLSVAIPSNWLLEKHPDAYLYATLFYAECYLDNATRAAQWKGLLDEVMGRITRNAKGNRFGAGPLVPNTVAQVSGSRC